MKMIKSHVELLTQQYDKLGIYEMVELAGRTSYKSEKNMSFDENGRSTTAEAFTNKLISYNHGAALEHATIYLTIPKTETLIGCLAAQGTSCFNYSYVVYVPVNQKIKVHKPTKKQCPDAHITGEVWYTGKPIELVPIGKLYTSDNLFEVGKYPAADKNKNKKKRMISSYACEYAFVPLKTSKK